MNETNQFTDPLDEIINRHKMVEDSSNKVEETDTNNNNTEAILDEEINYGENDLQEEMDREEKEEALMREQQKEEELRKYQEESRKDKLPPNSLFDKKFQKEAMDFQTQKLEVVTNMIQSVLKKNNITNGGIPDGKRRYVMGNLIEMYEQNGEVITPEFENEILSNWKYIEVENTANHETSNTEYIGNTKPDENESNNENVINDKPVNININVPEKTPITVNVDDSITANIKHTNVVNVNVREVSEEQIKKMVIVENSMDDGIITPYDSGFHDTPVTLPISGYRCVIRPVNWLESMELSAPSSRNPSDAQRKKWNIIFKHMKNVSIGNFATFDDFIKNTKYADGELLMWGVLVASTSDSEVVTITCGNRNCGHRFDIQYNPRTILHLVPERIPENFRDIDSVAAGPEAMKLFNSISKKRYGYELPDSKIVVELNEPSMYEYIVNKLPGIQTLYRRYRPDDPNMENYRPQTDEELAEFEYKMALLIQISAVSIVKDGKQYRYTDWDYIERIITESISSNDSAILMRLISTVRTTHSPVELYISDITCPNCGNRIDRIDIDDVGETLLFHLSRRQESMEINLKEMD